MRDFSKADKERKRARIQIPPNPDNLSAEKLEQLESVVKESLVDGYLSCPVAWKIAKDVNVSKMAVGEIMDRLSIRIADCQIGFFKKDKTAYVNPEHKSAGVEIITALKRLDANEQLTCAGVFDLAKQFKLKPIIVSKEASAQGLKISNCQLGCF